MERKLERSKKRFQARNSGNPGQCSGDGSSTVTGWNLRSRAASFSMYFRYSVIVVAPISCNSPLAREGFNIFEASMAPSAPVLSRRTKNNPCLVGEPGVGKTAVVEGLAAQIAAGAVPDRTIPAASAAHLSSMSEGSACLHNLTPAAWRLRKVYTSVAGQVLAAGGLEEESIYKVVDELISPVGNITFAEKPELSPRLRFILEERPSCCQNLPGNGRIYFAKAKEKMLRPHIRMMQLFCRRLR